MGGVAGRRHNGQSLVEFSVVVGAFVILLFAAVSAAFHSVQRAMAETAAATGIQIAASAPATGNPTQSDLRGAIGPTEQLLRSTMFGTNIGQPSGGVGVPCDPMNAIPQGSLQVCAYQAAPGMVGETVRGHPAYLVPFLSQWLPWSIDVTLEMHQVGYQP
jgi:hypothetical protein